MAQLYRLMYVSTAVDELSYSDLDHILTAARFHNAQVDVTGLLIYRDGLFLQVLEGPFKSVREVLSRVILDQKHSNLRVLFEGPADERFFEDWGMAFLDSDLSEENDKRLQKLFSDSMLFSMPDCSSMQNMLKEISANL